MEIKTYAQRILIPDEGKYLYNETIQVISEKVYLGINADEKEWIEITEEQKQEIEKQLYEKADGLDTI
jgi:hypothetical protein